MMIDLKENIRLLKTFNTYQSLGKSENCSNVF